MLPPLPVLGPWGSEMLLPEVGTAFPCPWGTVWGPPGEGVNPQAEALIDCGQFSWKGLSCELLAANTGSEAQHIVNPEAQGAVWTGVRYKLDAVTQLALSQFPQASLRLAGREASALFLQTRCQSTGLGVGQEPAGTEGPGPGHPQLTCFSARRMPRGLQATLSGPCPPILLLSATSVVNPPAGDPDGQRPAEREVTGCGWDSRTYLSPISSDQCAEGTSRSSEPQALPQQGGRVCPGWGGQSSRDEGNLPSPEPTHGQRSLHGAEQSSRFSPRSFP